MQAKWPVWVPQVQVAVGSQQSILCWDCWGPNGDVGSEKRLSKNDGGWGWAPPKMGPAPRHRFWHEVNSCGTYTPSDKSVRESKFYVTMMMNYGYSLLHFYRDCQYHELGNPETDTEINKKIARGHCYIENSESWPRMIQRVRNAS